MLVDDDEDDKMIFMSVVNEINSQIACKSFDNAVNGLQSLQTDKNKPDCIFLDLNMPFMHGFEFLKLIKTTKELDDIPVIIYSTTANPEQVKKTYNKGANLYMQKPSSYEGIKKLMNKILSADLFDSKAIENNLVISA